LDEVKVGAGWSEKAASCSNLNQGWHQGLIVGIPSMLKQERGCVSFKRW